MHDLADEEYNRMEWSNLFERIDRFSFDSLVKIDRKISIRYSSPQMDKTKQEQQN